jgi:DNA-binding transcriptional regulator YiaG
MSDEELPKQMGEGMEAQGNDGRKDLLDKLRLTLAAGEVPTGAVKPRRDNLGVSQYEFVRLSGVSQAVIFRIEVGGKLPTNG